MQLRRDQLGRPLSVARSGEPSIRRGLRFLRANQRAPRGSAVGWRSEEGQRQAECPPRRCVRLGSLPPCMMSGRGTCKMFVHVELSRFALRAALQSPNLRVHRVLAVTPLCASSRESRGDRRFRVARMPVSALCEERSIAILGGVIIAEFGCQLRSRIPPLYNALYFLALMKESF